MATWEVFATAPDQLMAEMWRDLVLQAGVECAIRAGDTISFLGVSPLPVRLVARGENVERARAALEAALGSEEEPDATWAG